MESGELFLSVKDLNRLFVALIYVPVVWLVYRQRIPRLCAGAKLLATIMLAAQVMVIVASLEIQPRSEVEEWFWHLDEEWNVPSALATVQLTLVGAYALVTAALARKKTAWERLYFVAIALLFYFIANDEFNKFHESLADWQRFYVVLGAVVVGLTAAVILVSCSSARIWHLQLLAGLGLSALGGLVVEQIETGLICEHLGALNIDDCSWRYYVEEPLEFLGVWLILAAVLGHFSANVRMPGWRSHLVSFVLTGVCLGLLILVSPARQIHLPGWARPAAIHLESGAFVAGYRVAPDELRYSIVLNFPIRFDTDGLGFSVHLIDQVSGESIAGANKHVSRKNQLSGYKRVYRPLYRQDVEIQVSAGAPTNRAMWIVLTIWREQDGAYPRERIISSDLPLLADSQVILGELALPAAEAGGSPFDFARFGNGFSLDRVDLPARVPAGERLPITFAWRAQEQASEDYAQFLHLGHEVTGEWWVHDQLPLGARLPTRLWYAGLADSETWLVPLPADLEPGRYAVYTGLYRLSDGERVAVSDAEGKPWLDNRAWLGSIVIEG